MNSVCGKDGTGDTRVLRTGGKLSSQFVDFAVPIVLLLGRGEVIEMRGVIECRTKLLSGPLLSTTWLTSFIKKFLVYFLGSIDFAMNYNHTEQKQKW